MITRDGNRLLPKGALTVANVAQLCESGKQQFGEGDLVIDLAEVTEVDSAALSLLLEWQREGRRRDTRLAFRNLPASLVSLAKLYGVLDLIAGDAKTAK